MDYAENNRDRDGTEPEALVVGALRKMVFSQGGCGSLGNEFGGPARSVIRDAVALFLQKTSKGSRRMLTVGYPGCAEMTADERQMLAVLAASQADDDALLVSHLSWLVQAKHRAGVAEAAHMLGQLSRLQGLNLRLPEAQSFPVPAGLCVVRENSHVA